jgi:hypothetical protein
MWFSGVNKDKKEIREGCFGVSLRSLRLRRCGKTECWNLLEEGGGKLQERARSLELLKALNYC